MPPFGQSVEAGVHSHAAPILQMHFSIDFDHAGHEFFGVLAGVDVIDEEPSSGLARAALAVGNGDGQLDPLARQPRYLARSMMRLDIRAYPSICIAGGGRSSVRCRERGRPPLISPASRLPRSDSSREIRGPNAHAFGYDSGFQREDSSEHHLHRGLDGGVVAADSVDGEGGAEVAAGGAGKAEVAGGGVLDAEGEFLALGEGRELMRTHRPALSIQVAFCLAPQNGERLKGRGLRHS